MSAADSGGPAFPRPNSLDASGFTDDGAAGMTLRDYFIAHAPAEPQRWFQPVMPTARPSLPEGPFDPSASKQQLDYVREYADVMKPEEAKTPPLREYVAAYKVQHRAMSIWDAECVKQQYVQWPAAWADEQLKARAA